MFPSLSGDGVDGHWCTQESEGGVTQIGDGLATEGEVGVVGPPGGGFDFSTHLGTLACIPDQDNHDSLRVSMSWQEEGPSLMREVSSAYCRRLILPEMELRL